MAVPPDNLLQYIRHVSGVWRDQKSTDAELLSRFAAHRDQGAFTALVVRHGRLVWSICQSVLQDTADIEDAFQATFLALARQAATVNESLPGWLRRVANRVSLKCLRTTVRRDRRHQKFRQTVLHRESEDATSTVDDASTRAVVQEELDRLPEKLRVVLIQYYLRGNTQAQIAEMVGQTEAAVRKRLNRGLEILQKRLAGRGLTVSASAIAGLFGADIGVAAALENDLVRKTVEGACAALDGGAAGATPPAALAAGVQAPAHVKRLVVLLISVTVAIGAGLAAGAALLEQPAPPATPVTVLSAPGESGEATAEGRTVELAGRVLGADGGAVPGAAVTVLARRPFGPGNHGLRDDVLARTTAAPDGTFRVPVPADFPTWFPTRQVTVLASTPGKPPVTAIVSLEKGRSAGVTLRLPAAGRTVRGRLVDHEGAAANGVRLHVIGLGDAVRQPVPGAAGSEPFDPNWPAPVVSDGDGRFELTGTDPARGIWLQVDDDRYADHVFKLSEAGDQPVVRLQPARLVVGRVVAEDTGLPVPGVKLTARTGGGRVPYLREMVAGHEGFAAAEAAERLDSAAGAEGRFRIRLPAAQQNVIEVHPPAGAPYVATWILLEWGQLDPTKFAQRVAVTLPRGAAVGGRVVDERGEAVPGARVQFRLPQRGSPAYRPNLVANGFLNAITTAGSDGRFRITVPSGPVLLMAHGPTHEYRTQPSRWFLASGDGPDRWRWRDPASDDRPSYAHDQRELNLQPNESLSDVRLQLTRGETVSGKLLGPGGEPTESAVLLCHEKVSALTKDTLQPLPTRGGRYELPGCVRGRTYPVLFWDAEHDRGAAVDLGSGATPGPDVRLAPCGSVRVRTVDAAGRPLAGRGVQLYLVPERSFAGEAREPRRGVDAIESGFFNPQHVFRARVSDDDGWLTLPGLIPGAVYVARYDGVQNPAATTAEFRVGPGEVRHLPDLVMPATRNRVPPRQAERPGE